MIKTFDTGVKKNIFPVLARRIVYFFTNTENMSQTVAFLQVIADHLPSLVDQASALTSSGGIIVVETADTTVANTASSNTLASMFEIIKFLPTMALIA